MKTVERCTGDLDCRGKPAPQIFDRFKRSGREYIVTSVEALLPPRRHGIVVITHRITFSEVHA